MRLALDGLDDPARPSKHVPSSRRRWRRAARRRRSCPEHGRRRAATGAVVGASRRPGTSVARPLDPDGHVRRRRRAPAPRARSPRRSRRARRMLLESSLRSQPLSARASSGDGRREVSWLPGRPPAPSRPALRSSGCGLRPRAGGIPGHSGGSAPDSHRLPCTTDPDTGRWYRGRERVTVNLTRIYTSSATAARPTSATCRACPRRTRGSRPTARSTSSTRSSASRSRWPGCRSATAGCLRRVQNDLFDVGADISVPARRRPRAAARDPGADRRGWSRPATRSTPSSRR